MAPNRPNTPRTMARIWEVVRPPEVLPREGNASVELPGFVILEEGETKVVENVLVGSPVL